VRFIPSTHSCPGGNPPLAMLLVIIILSGYLALPRLCSPQPTVHYVYLWYRSQPSCIKCPKIVLGLSVSIGAPWLCRWGYGAQFNISSPNLGLRVLLTLPPLRLRPTALAPAQCRCGCAAVCLVCGYASATGLMVAQLS